MRLKPQDIQIKRDRLEKYVQEGLLPKVFEKEAFVATSEPYEFLHSKRSNPFLHNRLQVILQENAQAVGYVGFGKTYKAYENSLKDITEGMLEDWESMTQFENQPLTLKCGEWICNGEAIYKPSPYGDLVACVHPIMPIKRLHNVDTNTDKLVIAYRRCGKWKTYTADKKTLAGQNTILELANVGVAVNSDNAKTLIQYLHDIENLNYEVIPEEPSVSHLGWTDDGDFAPYIKGIAFDADVAYKPVFDSIRERGSRDDWMRLAASVRKYSAIAPKIMLAASFASVLVKPLGVLPFFVHAWGTTGGGKTVALMLAASVWADPQKGKYWRTFDGTAVSQERHAGFLHSLPLILDELQLVKDKNDFDKTIYQLSEGIGRSRGQKTGGVQKLETWELAIITSGESPLTNLNSGGGAVNRVIDVACGTELFADPRNVANTVRENFGFAGKEFVQKLDENGIEYARKVYNEFYDQIISGDTTEKQTMAAACVLTADKLIGEWIFNDGCSLRVKDVTDMLQTKTAVDANKRGYQAICESVAMNISKFANCNERYASPADKPKSSSNETWGFIDGNQIWMIRSVFGSLAKSLGYSDRAVLSYMAENNLCECSFTNNKRVPTIVRKSGFLSVRYVVFTPSDEEENEDEPF